MAGRPNQIDQRRLPLSQDSRFAVLAKIDCARLGLTERAWYRLRLLLEAIELSTTRDGPVVPVEVLASKCRCDRQTIMRSAKSGRHAGILNWEHERTAEGRQGANRWLVAWDHLASLAGHLERDRDRGPPPAPPDKKPVDTLAHEMSLWSQKCHSGSAAPSYSELILKQTSSFPGSQTGDTSDRRLEGDLILCGVDQAAVAIRVAREQGCSVEYLAELVAHWRSLGGGTSHAAWGPGALYHRFKSARPQLEPTRGWPNPSPAWLRHLDDERRAKAAAARAPATAGEPVERFAGSMLAEFQRIRTGGG